MFEFIKDLLGLNSVLEHSVFPDYQVKFVFTAPPTGPTVEFRTSAVTYLKILHARPQSWLDWLLLRPAEPMIYITHVHWVQDGQLLTVSRDELIEGFSTLISRTERVRGALNMVKHFSSDKEIRQTTSFLTAQVFADDLRLRHGLQVCRLTGFVGRSLEYLATAERTGVAPSRWERYPEVVDAQALSDIPPRPPRAARWTRYWMSVDSDFFARVVVFVNKFGLPLSKTEEASVARVVTPCSIFADQAPQLFGLFPEYLLDTSTAFSAPTNGATVQGYGRDATDAPPPYTAAPTL